MSHTLFDVATVCVCVSPYACLSHPMRVCLTLPLSHPMRVCLTLALSHTMSVCLTLYTLCVCLTLCLSHTMSVCVSVSHYVCLCRVISRCRGLLSANTPPPSPFPPLPTLPHTHIQVAVVPVGVDQLQYALDLVQQVRVCVRVHVCVRVGGGGGWLLF